MQNNEKISNPTKDDEAQENSVNDLSYPQWMPRGLFRAIGPISLVVLVVAVAVGFYAHEHVTKDSVRFQFWVGFMFSFLAFVVLLVQSVIYAQQAEFMKQQSKSMQETVERTDRMIENMQGQLTSMVHQEEAMKGQLDAMKEQVRLASKQTDLSSRQIDLLVLNECAYVGVGDFQIPPIKDYNLIVTGKFFNGGRTPAWDFKRKVGILLGDAPPPEGWTYNWDAQTVRESDSIFIVAQDSVKFDSEPLKITHEDFDKINSGETVIALVGECRYLDSLGGRQVYSFGVFFEFDPPRNPRAIIRYQHHRREKANPN